jgi:CDP-glycerol glycerophosphotransferase
VRRQWDHQIANWQYVLSPNAFTTGVLQRAFAIEGEMLETGYPRNDVLASPARDEIASDVRRRLGLPADVRVVLYAPTYRDHVVDKRSRFRLDPKFDVSALSRAAGDDTIILFRGHPYITGTPWLDPGGRVRDVSAWKDGTELLLVADALVTDYSSVMFDFANTGKPMLFYTYDLEVFQERIRGFYLDLEETVPGPLLGSAAELGDALGGLDAVRERYADRYAGFAATFCPFDDGRATERVVDTVFERVREVAP